MGPLERIRVHLADSYRPDDSFLLESLQVLKYLFELDIIRSPRERVYVELLVSEGLLGFTNIFAEEVKPKHQSVHVCQRGGDSGA